jgi:hypothetical protein
VRFAPDKKISGSSQNRACIAHGACIPESREKALSHMAFATLPSFCKRECKTRAMSESRLVMRKKPDFTMVFVIGPRVRRVAGGARFGLVPLCPSRSVVGKEPEPQRRDKPGAWSLSLVAIEAGAMRSTRLCWRSCNADPRSDASNVAKPAKHRGPLSRTSCRGAEARGWIRYPAATQYLHSFEMGLIPHHDGPRSETDIHELAAFVER